jgi:hypothetical protein
MKLALVIWRDAATLGGGFRGRDTLGTLATIHTAGLLVDEDDEKITLATDWDEGDDSFRYIHHIPHVNVVEVRVVEADEKTARKSK